MCHALTAVIVIATVLAAGPACSADQPTLEERAAAIERASTAPDGDRVVLGHISRKLGIPVETLRTQRKQTGLGWGELLIAHRLSRETGLGFEQLIAELRSGKDWAQIATDHNVDVGKLISEVRQSQEVVERRGEDRAPRQDMGSDLGPSSPGVGGSGARPGGGAGSGHGGH